MRRIGIYGSYSEHSIGDHYILEGIITQIERGFEDEVEFVIFSHSPPTTRSLINNGKINITPASPKVSDGGKDGENNNQKGSPHPYNQIIKSTFDSYPNLWFLHDPIVFSNYNFWSNVKRMMEDLDLFLFGGGNILMDLYPSGVPNHYIYSKIASRTGTPSMYYSIGAGPFRSKRGIFYFNRVFNNIDCLTTRDVNSLNLINKNINTKDVNTELAADPAVCLQRAEPGPNTNNRDEHPERTKAKIAVSLVPYHMKGYWPDADEKKYHTYLEGMCKSLTKIFQEEDVKIEFFATNHPTDLEPAERIIDKMGDDIPVSISRKRKTGEELVNWLSNCEYVFCTRLHSLIPTFVAGTPFIAYAYQPKVKNFCDRIGFPEQVINLPQNPDEMRGQTVTAFERAEAWSGDIPDHEEKLQELRDSSRKSVRLARNLIY